MKDECFGLERLKKEYEKAKKKYNLPEFDEMNKEFEIEKLQERESDLLLREIRRAISEKNMAYLRFIEMFLNPGNAPMFFLSLVKNMDGYNRKLLEELYSEFGKFEIKSIALDNEYDESKELAFIKNFIKKWKELKSKFSEITDSLEESWEKKSERKEKGYLG